MRWLPHLATMMISLYPELLSIRWSKRLSQCPGGQRCPGAGGELLHWIHSPYIFWSQWDLQQIGKETISPEHVIQGKWYLWDFVSKRGRGHPAGRVTRSCQSLQFCLLVSIGNWKAIAGKEAAGAFRPLCSIPVVLSKYQMQVRVAGD